MLTRYIVKSPPPIITQPHLPANLLPRTNNHIHTSGTQAVEFSAGFDYRGFVCLNAETASEGKERGGGEGVS